MALLIAFYELSVAPMVDPGSSQAAGGSNGDVKTTQKLSQIASDAARRLVEYFVIVSSVERTKSTDEQEKPSGDDAYTEWKTDSYDEEDESNLFRDHKFRPSITARYPLHDHADNPLHENVTFFCHPTGAIHLRTEEYLPKVGPMSKKNHGSDTHTHPHAKNQVSHACSCVPCRF